MPRMPRLSGRSAWLRVAGSLALVVGLLVLALPHTGVREMVAHENDPELRVLAQRLTAMEDLVAQQSRALDELRAENEHLRTVQDELTDDGATGGRGYAVRLYPVPERVELLGEELPLDRPDVHQRFEEEWTRFQLNRHWLVKWHRRSREVFPFVERRLADAGMPDDLKYVMVIESGLEARAVSSAGAEGWWQFMLATGERYGLERTNYLDDRRSLERATDAAIRHFRDLYESLGSWPLVLSAYNAGESRVRTSMEEQGESSFYDMVLPTETEAYWFKAAAAKAILESSERYQLHLSEDGWAPVVCDTLDIRVLVNRLELRTLAASSGLTYREIKTRNPWIRRSYLPLGEFRLVVPADQAQAVVAALDGAKLLRHAQGIGVPALAETEASGEADTTVRPEPVPSSQRP